MSTSELISCIGVCISFAAMTFSVMFSFKNSKKTDVKELEARIAENTRLNIKLDNIMQDISEIKEEFRLQRQEVQNLVERMARVEASAKQAHHRLDCMTGKNDQRQS